MKAFISLFLVMVWGHVEAFGRYSMVAKQHETPLIDTPLNDFRDR